MGGGSKTIFLYQKLKQKLKKIGIALIGDNSINLFSTYFLLPIGGFAPFCGNFWAPDCLKSAQDLTNSAQKRTFQPHQLISRLHPDSILHKSMKIKDGKFFHFWAHLCVCTVGSYASLCVRLSVCLVSLDQNSRLENNSYLAKYSS